MKNKFLTYLIVIYLNFFSVFIAVANDFTFDTSEITIFDNGNIIKANNGTAKSDKDNVIITSEKFEYNKKLSTLNAINGIAKYIENNIDIKANNLRYNTITSIIEAEGNAVAKSNDDNINIKANRLEYDSTLFIIIATGDVEIRDLTKNILIKSQKISFNTKNEVIESKVKSSIEDNLGNIFFADSFKYTSKDDLLKINKAKVIDFEKNTYEISKAFVNLKSNKLIGKDVSIDYKTKYFDKKNEPRLKGNSVSSNKEETIVKKGIFTTCKKTDSCPPWQISAEEIRHDRNKKTINYKNAWLKLYDNPVFYFPTFFHPDPTVKRQSGFLMPKFDESSTLGSALHMPYFYAISENKDLTFMPRFYSNDKVLFQNEYREVNALATHHLDFSYMQQGSASGKSHFFSRSNKKLDFANFEETELNLQLEKSSHDTYLKTYKIKSPIIKNTDNLTSTLGISAFREDLSFMTEFKMYENLSKRKSDRYEFVYPAFDLNLLNPLQSEEGLEGGELTLNSSGYLKNYATNIFEKVLINDLIYNSDPKFTETGFKNNFNFLIKNVNTDSDNSKKYKKERDHKLNTLLEYNSSYPLKKINGKYTDILKPKFSLKYSPNKTKNMRDEDKKIDTSNIFSLQRIGVDDTVEGGASLTYGGEFSKTNNDDREIFGAKIANVLRLEENDNLAKTNSLGDKTSDFVGDLNFSPNKFFGINYGFALANNLTDTKFQTLSTEIEVNNFVTTFEYFNENNTLKSESYLTNSTKYNFSESQSLMFKGRQNKKTDATEFYNLIYQYRNDCLIAAIEYNKEYYSDGDLRPDESIFFKLTIVPFGETNSPNLKQ